MVKNPFVTTYFYGQNCDHKRPEIKEEDCSAFKLLFYYHNTSLKATL